MTTRPTPKVPIPIRDPVQAQAAQENRAIHVRRAAKEILPHLVRYYFYEVQNQTLMNAVDRNQSAEYVDGQSLLAEKVFAGEMQAIMERRQLSKPVMTEAIRHADAMLKERQVLKTRKVNAPISGDQLLSMLLNRANTEVGSAEHARTTPRSRALSQKRLTAQGKTKRKHRT